MSGDFEREEIVFNPIDYEMKREGDGAGETQNITNIFMNIYRMGNRIASEGDTKEERYWDTALKRCLNRVIELLKLAQEDLSYSNMVKVVSSCGEIEKDDLVDAIIALERESEIADTKSDRNYCLNCLLNAYFYTFNEEDIDQEKRNAFNLVEDYFTQAMPVMGNRTKSVVTESFMGLAEPFLSGLLYKHFSGKTNIYPEWTYEKNKIIVLDFPIKEYLDAGIIGQCVFKLLFQQAVERRNVNLYPTPVFLWCDEAQYFVNPYDQIFLTTARSSRTATVFLSQNISNYFAVMGSGSDAKARVDSLMGNLCTKIFHANSDAVTNDYASQLIGNDVVAIESGSKSMTSFSLKDSRTLGYGMQLLPQVLPKVFVGADAMKVLFRTNFGSKSISLLRIGIASLIFFLWG
ncbi:MAG: TraM recognition domain-containing protein [Bacteroidetes bacterium]|nr:TraM recognition domain-containing protein [Bacteroidota bacterium]